MFVIDNNLILSSSNVTEICKFNNVKILYENVGNYVHNSNYTLFDGSEEIYYCKDLERVDYIKNTKCIIIKVDNLQEVINMLNDQHIKPVNYIEVRPWGKFENIIDTDIIKTKFITVNPNGVLSLQRHFFRSEHHYVLNGYGKLLLGYDLNNMNVIPLYPGKYVYIGIKEYHRIINNSSNDLIILEVQNGEKVIESDIERVGDIYGRS